ncbi:hypothetical protein Poli38472_014158 [Pythium oligandrum]|uniref:Uncharacterized protein n=1 Tax=Pythium oligandrum TaxID=41045 RepID=A0A8K1CI71_PYTOL|nr:hypothetical protein Poli38472_014158 [Pythium oligandrum]|eukprot:TMW64041.1 hypothetical protein Poli38472_014158 [Pythium oligandrum]
MKFSAVFATVLATLAGVQAQDRPACVPINYTEKTTDFKTLNGVVDLAVNTGLLKTFIKPYDPLVLTNQRLDVVPFSVLGHDFELTPIIKTLNATGITTIVPRHFDVTGPSGLGFGVDFNGTIAADATLTFEIAQVNKQWWQLCYTDLLHPAECKPSLVDVDVGLGVDHLAAGLNFTLALNQCPPTAPAGTCKNLLVGDLLTAALTQKFDALLKRILLRIQALTVDAIDLKFNQLTKLNFHFHSSGPLITEIGKKLLGFSADELNKKGDVYNIAIKLIASLGKSLANNLVQSELASQFGNGCYDA